MPPEYLDVRVALGGYQVIYVTPRAQRQVIVETAADVAAMAILFQLAVLSVDADVRLACRAAGVRLIERQEDMRR